MSNAGLAGKDWGGLGGGGSALGLPSLRCLLDGHGEQAVGGSLGFRGAPSGWRGPESEWGERQGLRTTPWGHHGSVRGRRRGGAA